MKQRLNEILAQHTGQSLAKVEKDADRDYYMTAEEAKAYGLIDQIVDKTSVPKVRASKSAVAVA